MDVNKIVLLSDWLRVLKIIMSLLMVLPHQRVAGPHSEVGSASVSRTRDPGFDTRSGHILSFLLPLIQEGRLSVTGESMCT